MTGEPDRALEIKLEGQATFLGHAFETYQAVAAALRRGAPDALASKVAVATQWVARNHEEVDRRLIGALAKTDLTGAEGALAARIRRLPALRSELVARLEQRLATTRERAGGLTPLLIAAQRRSHLAWSRYERDWQLDDGPVLRIPDGFTVTELGKSRVTVRWSTSGIRHGQYLGGSLGRFELDGKVLVVPAWLFSTRRLQLSAVRTYEYETRHRGSHVQHLHLHGADRSGAEQQLFAIPSLYDAEFICAVICHFTAARRDSHWLRR